MIAIVKGKGGFTKRWVDYCEDKHIPYKLINVYDSNVVEQVSNCDVVMWHYHHNYYKDTLFAKELLYSLECSGKKVFPDWHTNWHFDDKVGQKYLLESIGAPLVPSFVFYSEKDSIEWLKRTDYPKVFKLRGGAGSQNVVLVNDFKEAKKMVHKAFTKGFPHKSLGQTYRENKRLMSEGKITFLYFAKVLIAGIVKPILENETFPPQRGYVYFQDFIPNNPYDIRVVVIDEKAFAIKRMVRDNDFRASGSGHIRYNKEELSEECVKVAFDVTKKIKAQCLGFDFVFHNGKPEIVEMSYGFSPQGYDACEGYWTDDMCWHQEKFNPQGWMINSVVGGDLDKYISEHQITTASK